MRTLPMRDAKASVSAVVEAAQRGEPTTITKYGKPAAVVTPLPSFAADPGARNEGLIDHLLAMPEGLDLERERWELRDLDRFSL